MLCMYLIKSLLKSTKNQFRMITMVDKILNRHSWDNCYAELLSNQCLCDTEIP